MQTVDHKLVEIALERTNGTDFEDFFQAFYPAVAGIEFVPLGGTHDGGGDAFQGEGLFGGKPGIFYQASTQADHRAKIRHTVKRLRKVGREPKTVHYCTSRSIDSVDKEEEKLSDELRVAIRIRDRKWINGNINRSPQTVAAFKSYLSPHIAFLNELGSATVIKHSTNVPARTMCVFLGQEIDRRRGNTELLEAVTDSLILWALEGTNPDTNNFMTRDEIFTKIEEVLPSAKHFIRKVFDHRIELLSSKGNSTGREIRWHKKADKFCLPYETRTVVNEENVEDEFLKLQIMDLYRMRAREALEDEDTSLPDVIANVVHRALELTFEKEGLKLAEFLSGTRDEDALITIPDQIDEANEEAELTGSTAITVKEVALEVLRQAFYNSTEEERIYYGKLSRTYVLMFTLHNEPKIVEYFKGMSSNFVLFVGSDIIIRALSERYLATKDQMTINLLRILKEAGSTLILTQMAVEEVQSHLEGTDYEFRNFFMHSEADIDKEIARHAGKILIRTYFYAKLDPNQERPPKRWEAFIEQICSYRDLHSPEKSRKQIKDYLIEKFEMEYFDEKDFVQITTEDEVRPLADKIQEFKLKKAQELALNDARHILGVYGNRRVLQEDHKPNPYGYRTWWLTHETRVRKVTKDLVIKRGSEYIIRPEFILNFVALSPTTEQVRQSYNTIFPSLLGVRLSNRMREDIFHDAMQRVKEMREVDEPRAKTMMAEMSNKLKGDNFKAYESKFTSEGDER